MPKTEISLSNAVADGYATLVQEGKIKLDGVPAKYRAAVEERLEKGREEKE